MNQSRPFVITISRQIGSGGAYIGQQLAKRLNIYYADCGIIIKVANQLSSMDKDWELRNEKLQSLWKTFIQFSSLASDAYLPSKVMMPTSHELFKVESEIIEHIAKEQSAIIIGRCGFHVLRKYHNRINIFLHGDITFRKERVQKLYNVSEEVAEKMIAQSDKGRSLYIKTFTGNEWTDARLFDLSIDTSKTGVNECLDFILNYLEFTIPKITL